MGESSPRLGLATGLARWGDAMIKTRRIGYATFETPDLERQIDYYTQIFGLTLTERDKRRAFLSTPLGQQVVVLERGDHARCMKIAFEADAANDLTAIARRCRQKTSSSTGRAD
jgi:catechol-2,3-dioxygenase